MSSPNNPCLACGFDPDLPYVTVGELTVPISYPSQNSLGANSRGIAGYHYRKLRQEFAGALHGALMAQGIPKAGGKRRVWLTRIYRPGKRPYDDANLRGGGKAIVDCLVTRGLLKDDSPRWFEGIYSQVPGPDDAIHLRFDDLGV